MKRALFALNNYLDCNNSILSTSDIEDYEEIKKESLNEYRYLSNKILDFSIEKDTSKVIYKYLENNNSTDEYNTYKEELEQLGIFEDITSNKKAH